MTKDQTDAVIAVIRILGFIGNAHYCPHCLNHFHDDRGQHKSDCAGLAELQQDEEWWDIEERLKLLEHLERRLR
jgi:hypothetical protein